MRIILVGFGVVGQSLLRMANSRHADLIRTTGIRPKFVGVCDSRGAAVSVRGLDVERLLQMKGSKGTVAALREFGKVGITPSELIEDTEAGVVVEATSTNLKNGQPGIHHIMTSLKNRRHVITVNKGPLAHALPALLELAKHNDVYLRFSGTVGGGTPVLDFAKKCLLGERIVSLRGILNGTTNYILTKMADEGISYEMALKEAQRAGYAEKDPSLDVDGLDTAAKLVIIANWVMNLRVTLSDV
ncbi:MAG: homoserine dehydrogenase, partial [Candidatus Bathyarchaeia archaeon]